MKDQDKDKRRGGKPGGSSRSERPRFSRDGTPGEGRKPYQPRGERPAGGGERPRFSREGTPGEGRKSYQPRGERPAGGGERPRFNRDGAASEGRKPYQPRGERPAGGAERTRFSRDGAPGEGRKPYQPRGERPAGGGERPRFNRDGAAPEGRKPYQPRGERPAGGGERPARSEPASAATGSSGAAGLERIAKVMARAGLCSRRDAEEWILAGRVSVNGRRIDSPALDVSAADVILVDGAPLPARERTRLWLYHKPRGLVTTADDPEGRNTVFDNLPADLPRVISIGRLDINTEGLLLLTNDGGLARVLGHPTTGWLRRYRVRAHGKITQAALDGLREGVTLEGIDYEPIIATLDRQKGDNCWLTMDLTEGKNREIKKVLEHLGLQVGRLIRISFGPFQLGAMAEGAVEEIRTRMLKDQLGPRLSEEAGVDFDSPLFAGSGNEPAEEPRRKRYLSKEGFQERRRKATLGQDEGLSIERGAVADRKGRAVQVERIRVAPEPEPEPVERPMHRRDGGQRPEGGRNFQRGDRRERAYGASGERPARPPRQGGDGRAAGGYGQRDRGERTASAFRSESTRAPRAEGERPAGGRSFDKRPGKAFGGKPDGKSFGSRSFGDKPAGGRAAGGHPSGGRPSGGRPFAGKGSGGRPGGGGRPAGGKPGGRGPYKPR